MRPGLALAATLSLAVAGCGHAAPLVTVDQLLAQCHALKGKPIQLAGYLGDCSGYECDLTIDEAHWVAFGNAINKMHGKPDPAELVEARARVIALWPVSIGGGAAFVRKAAPLQHSYVVISGAVADDICDRLGGTDRSASIAPVGIRAWTRSEGAPANTK